MNIRFFLFFLTALYSQGLSAQKLPDSVQRFNNAAYFELGGPTLAYAVGYERALYQSLHFAFMASAGFSYIPSGITMVYIEPGVLFRHKNMAFELGLALGNYYERARNGERFNTESGNASLNFLAPRAGVRFFSKNQHIHFRLGLTPIIELNSEGDFIFWINPFTFAYRF